MDDDVADVWVEIGVLSQRIETLERTREEDRRAAEETAKRTAERLVRALQRGGLPER